MNPVQTNSAETIPMEEIDDLLDEVLDPKGNDLFPSRVLDVLLHPGQYLAWFRSTTESFQKEAKVYISLSEKHAAQHAFMSEMCNILEDKMREIEDEQELIKLKRPRLTRTESDQAPLDSPASVAGL